ncbi:MAG: phosphatidate cytidylyltransferase [Bacillota bacterium]
MLGQRVGSALVGLVIILGSLALGRLSFAVVVGVVIVLGAWEFALLARTRGVELSAPVIAAFSLTNLLYAVFYQSTNAVLPLLLLLLFFTWAREMLFGRQEGIGRRIGETIFGFLYTGVMFSFLYLVMDIPGYVSPVLALFCLMVTWCNDSGAYFVGMLHGKHLLCPAISPKKTLEGAAGGLLLGVLAAALFGVFRFIAIKKAISVGVLCVVVAQCGDLFESVLKRDAQVKDSGDLIPGHGGILDRFDSLLWVAPLVYYYFTFFG